MRRAALLLLSRRSRQYPTTRRRRRLLFSTSWDQQKKCCFSSCSSSSSSNNNEVVYYVGHGSTTTTRPVSMKQQFPSSSKLLHHQRTTTRWLSTSSSYSSSASDNNDNNDVLQQQQLKSFSFDAVDCNVTPNVASRIGRNLHRQRNHPLCILSKKIVEYFDDSHNDNFVLYDNFSPIVSTQQNFDSLRIPADHVSRSYSDTYYLDQNTVLRTHTSAHQVDILSSSSSCDGPNNNNNTNANKNNSFLVAGDVYRRDEIDRSHYPIFHQMEGVKIFNSEDTEFGSLSSHQEQVQYIEHDLKRTLEGLAIHLFGINHDKMRWVDEYFPFTDPSYELEILFGGYDGESRSSTNDNESGGSDNDDGNEGKEAEWMEVLGCGVIHPQIMINSNRPNEKGWAFGLGLERLAMILFDIPDIRLFWTTDQRFHNQFKSGDIVKFQPYSKYPPCYKDISFWLPPTTAPGEGESEGGAQTTTNYHVNDLHEIVRDIGGDLIEQVQLIDDFVHPKSRRVSHCYRISYRSMDRSLTNTEIDTIQQAVRDRVVKDIVGVELR